MALHYSGAQNCTVADTGVLRPSTAVFLGVWFRYTSATQSAFATFAGKEYNNVSPFNSYDIGMDGTSNSLKTAGHCGFTGSGQKNLASSVALTANSWYFAALSWSSNTIFALRIYDSTLTIVDTITDTPVNDTLKYDTSAFNIGEYVPGASSFFVGDVGAVIVTGTASTGQSDDKLYGQCAIGNFPVVPIFFTGLCSTTPVDLSANALAITNNSATLVADPTYTPCGVVAGTLPPLFGQHMNQQQQPLEPNVLTRL